MVFHMKHPKNFTTFRRDLRGHGIAHQQAMIDRWLAKHGAALVATYTAGEWRGGERDEWIRRTRATEGAIVAGLYVIPEPAAPGKRPSADFAAALQELRSSCALIVDAETGITSADGQAWRDLVVSAGHKTSAGRQLSSKEARKRARKRWDHAAPGAVAKWLSPQMCKIREQMAHIWRDAAYRNDATAFEAMPADVKAELGSPVNARRVFGRRKPGDATAGGRPPRKPKRKR